MANRTAAHHTDLQHILRWAPNSTLVTRVTPPYVNCSALTGPVQARKEPWVVPLVVLCTVNITAIAIFEAYVLYKSCGSRRHLFLGQVLLLGLFLSSLLGYAFVPDPNWFTCAVTRAGVGVACVLVFATLLVKLVFLLSLHVGAYLSAAYQGLLLFFAVAVQLVIAVQSLVYRPAITQVLLDTGSCRTACATPASDTVASLAYAMMLMTGVALLSVRGRSLRENHGEALYILVSVGLCVPLWVSWIVASSVSSAAHHDPCLAFGTVLTASIVFVVIFVPKARHLASLPRGGLYSDDGFSSVNQSVYTPSFLHLKPPLAPFLKQNTLGKPLASTFSAHQVEQRYFIPPIPSTSRLWRLSHHPSHLPLPPPPPPLHPPPEDIYISSDRYLFGHPAVKLYRTPLY